MSRRNTGEQAVLYQRLFPRPPCCPMIRNNWVFTQSLRLENYIKSTELLHKPSENKHKHAAIALRSAAEWKILRRSCRLSFLV